MARLLDIEMDSHPTDGAIPHVVGMPASATRNRTDFHAHDAQLESYYAKWRFTGYMPLYRVNSILVKDIPMMPNIEILEKQALESYVMHIIPTLLSIKEHAVLWWIDLKTSSDWFLKKFLLCCYIVEAHLLLQSTDGLTPFEVEALSQWFSTLDYIHANEFITGVKAHTERTDIPRLFYEEASQSVVDTESERLAFRQLRAIQAVSKSAQSTERALAQRPNAYHRLPNRLEEYMIYFGGNGKPDGKLVDGILSMEWKSEPSHRFEAYPYSTGDISTNKIAALFRHYNSVSIKALVVGDAAYKTPLDYFQAVFLVCQTVRGEFNYSDSGTSYNGSQMAFRGRFKNTELGSYVFEPFNPVLTFNPDSISVREGNLFRFILTTSLRSEESELVASEPNIYVEFDNLYGIWRDYGTVPSDGVYRVQRDHYVYANTDLIYSHSEIAEGLSLPAAKAATNWVAGSVDAPHSRIKVIDSPIFNDCILVRSESHDLRCETLVIHFMGEDATKNSNLVSYQALPFDAHNIILYGRTFTYGQTFYLSRNLGIDIALSLS